MLGHASIATTRSTTHVEDEDTAAVMIAAAAARADALPCMRGGITVEQEITLKPGDHLHIAAWLREADQSLSPGSLGWT